MPINQGRRPAPPWIQRQRGMKRLSAVTAGVGVASVIAAGAVAAALPGTSHTGSAAGTGTAVGAGTSQQPASTHATSGGS